MRLAVLLLSATLLGAASSHVLAGAGGGPPPAPAPRHLDCNLDAQQNCASPTPDCTNSGGYCVSGGSGPRFRDHDGNGCGCMI